jgi:OmpA-OmpF porin, OOP family
MQTNQSGFPWRPWWWPLALLLLPMIVCPQCHGPQVTAALAGGSTVAVPSPEPSASLPTEAPSASPAATTVTAATLTVQKDGEKVTLRGVVPDEATKSALVARARELYGEGNVTDELTIEADAEKAPWLASIGKLAPEFGKTWTGGGIEIVNGELILTGTLPSEDVHKKILDYYGPLAKAGGLTLVDKLVVVGAATPAPVAEKKLQTDLSSLALKTIEFETASATITSRGKRVLDEAAVALKSVPDAPVEIGGHTDDRGNDGANQTLSQRRAEATLRYLASKGIDKARLTAIGYGETKPLAGNDTQAGRQKNRRISFTLK